MHWTRLSALATLGLLILACGGDDSPLTPTGSEDTGTDSSDTGSSTTAVDPSITSGPVDPDSSGTEGGDTSDTGDTDAPPTCGNDLLEEGEVCDGRDLGSSCTDEGFDDGILGCAGDCSALDTSGCVSFSCGNAVIEGREACDGANLGGADCASEGFDTGTLACADDCSFDTSGCADFVCGDDITQGAEVCDGLALLGGTCESEGFDAGQLGCADDCTAYDTTACITFACGNDMVEGAEACDGSDLAGLSCTILGFDAGALTCLPDCSALDFTACQLFQCGNDLVEGLEACDGLDLAGSDCLAQGFDGGTLACDDGCDEYDTSACTLLSCGNDLAEGIETCDGLDLAGSSCIAQGFPGGGALACTANCQAYDASGCTFGCEEEDIFTATGLAVSMGSTVAEDDDLASPCAGPGPDRIVRFTAPSDADYVFDTFGSDYDTVLSLFTSCDPGSLIDCNDDAGASVQSQVFTSMSAGQTILVAVEGLGGSVGNYVLNIDELVCEAEENLGGMIGSPVATGTTIGEDEDLAQSCAAGGAVDRLFLFTAPAPATYVFDTFGSSYDTALAAYSTCAVDAEIICNDDAGVGLQSEISLVLGAGEQIYLTVSGFAGSTGDYVLNITQF